MSEVDALLERLASQLEEARRQAEDRGPTDGALDGPEPGV
jgi:hypothetical protein